VALDRLVLAAGLSNWRRDKGSTNLPTLSAVVGFVVLEAFEGRSVDFERRRGRSGVVGARERDDRP
jgi:hypothetical protein